MTSFHEGTSQIIDSNKINETIILLKNIFQKIKEKVAELKNKENPTENSVLIDHEEFKKETKYLKSLMNEVSDLLEGDNLFNKNEFVDFLMIQNMTEYILDNSETYIQNAQFIDELLIDFREIILKKLENDIEPINFDYDIEYESYESKLYEKKEYFYLHIYQSDDGDDDLIVDFVNALEGDGN